MTAFQAVFLGILQGLTEFLPISSSGHLVIGQKLLGLTTPPVFFDVFVHLGTLLAIICYFKQRIIAFYQKKDNLKLIIIGSLPACLAGFFLNNFLEVIFSSLKGVGFSLLITAGLLFSSLFTQGRKRVGELRGKDSLIIGLFQALALFPGVSRSGSTVTAGLWRGLKRKAAFNFSFFLGAPAFLAALILQLAEFGATDGQLKAGLAGFVFAFFSGLVSLKLFEKVVLKGKLFFFSLYCLFLGLGLVVFY